MPAYILMNRAIVHIFPFIIRYAAGVKHQNLPVPQAVLTVSSLILGGSHSIIWKDIFYMVIISFNACYFNLLRLNF